MTLRNILVHVAEDARCDERVALACDLAAKSDGMVTGLFARPYPIIVPAMPPGGAVTVVEDLVEVYDASSERTKKAFDELTSAKGVRAQWHSDQGETDECLAFHARYSDLVVVGQWSPDDPGEAGTVDLGGAVALGAGRPVLIVPYAGKFTTDWKRIMVAWDSSRAATRAVHDALEFMKAADQVDIVCVDADQSEDRDPGADIAAHLAQHGIKAKAHHVTRGSLTTAETLNSTASDMDSDLLVMGAYGHTRLTEIVFGGVSRNLLQHMTLPILMSH